jgi:hypothetical protein
MSKIGGHHSDRSYTLGSVIQYFEHCENLKIPSVTIKDVADIVSSVSSYALGVRSEKLMDE